MVPGLSDPRTKCMLFTRCFSRQIGVKVICVLRANPGLAMSFSCCLELDDALPFWSMLGSNYPLRGPVDA